jgi:uncharacterized protein YkwD
MRALVARLGVGAAGFMLVAAVVPGSGVAQGQRSASSGPGAVAPAGSAGRPRDDGAAAALVARINAMRNVRGLPHLQRHSGLEAVARSHSAAMAEADTLAHALPGRGDPTARVRAAGIVVRSLAENVARGADVGRAYRSLLESDAHRRQLLAGDKTHIGVGVVTRDGTTWLTQLLAKLDAAAAAAEPRPPLGVPAPVSTAARERGAVPAGVDPAPQHTRIQRPEGRGAPPRSRSGAAARRRVPVSEGPTPPPRSVAPQVEPSYPGQRPVRGYWVRWRDRWWYYPKPDDARPYDRLRPAYSVDGAPARPSPKAGPPTP